MAHVEQGGLCWAYICSLMADDGNGYVEYDGQPNRYFSAQLHAC